MKKLIVDILLFIFMNLEFSRMFLNSNFHEIFGVILLILMIIHLYLNRNYLKKVFKGKYNSKRRVMFAVNISFIVAFVFSILFGILSSEDILSFLNVRSLVIIKLHKIFSYISLILVGLHLGVNLNIMIVKLKRQFKNKILLDILGIVIVLYGIYSFFKQDILMHIIGYYEFTFSDCVFLINIMRYASIMMTFSIITHIIYNSCKKIKE